VKGAESLRDSVGSALGQAVGGEVAQVAGRIWTRVKSAFGGDDATTLEQFEKRPEAAAPLLPAMLAEKLDQDPDLVAELETLLDQRPGDSSQSVGTIIGEYVGYVDASHAQIHAPVTGLTIGGSPPNVNQPAGGDPSKP
jgi:hypothetical protein